MAPLVASQASRRLHLYAHGVAREVSERNFLDLDHLEAILVGPGAYRFVKCGSAGLFHNLVPGVLREGENAVECARYLGYRGPHSVRNFEVLRFMVLRDAREFAG